MWHSQGSGLGFTATGALSLSPWMWIWIWIRMDTDTRMFADMDVDMWMGTWPRSWPGAFALLRINCMHQTTGKAVMPAKLGSKLLSAAPQILYALSAQPVWQYLLGILVVTY